MVPTAMNLRITLTRDDNGTIMVTFPDFPEAVTYGDDEEETRLRAVALPTLMALKVGLYREMRAQKVTKAELARLLRWHAPQVDRLLDGRHHSHLDQMEAAFAALKKRIDVKISANRP